MYHIVTVNNEIFAFVDPITAHDFARKTGGKLEIIAR